MARRGTQLINGHRIPANAQLVKIGTGKDAQYVLMYEVYGVQMSYSIGTTPDLKQMFGADAIQQFRDSGDYGAYSDKQWEKLVSSNKILRMGPADELFGADSSLKDSIDDAMLTFLGTQPPKWIRQSEEVMTIYISGALEGMSLDAIDQAVSNTQAFKDRFSAYDVFRERMGAESTIGQVVQAMYLEESALESAWKTYRDYSNMPSVGQLQKILSTGWTAAQAAEVLKVERYLHDHPGAWRSLNQVLKANGLQPIGNAHDLLKLTQGNAPAAVYEALADAARRQALQQMGIDVNAALAAQLGTGDVIGTGLTALDFQEQAVTTADLIREARLDMALSRYGLNRNDILAAAFGQQEGSGLSARNPVEVAALLDKLRRERDERGEGYGDASGYINEQERLQLQGMAGL